MRWTKQYSWLTCSRVSKPVLCIFVHHHTTSDANELSQHREPQVKCGVGHHHNKCIFTKRFVFLIIQFAGHRSQYYDIKKIYISTSAKSIKSKKLIGNYIKYKVAPRKVNCGEPIKVWKIILRSSADYNDKDFEHRAKLMDLTVMCATATKASEGIRAPVNSSTIEV